MQVFLDSGAKWGYTIGGSQVRLLLVLKPVLLDKPKALYIKAFELFRGVKNKRLPFSLPFTAFYGR